MEVKAGCPAILPQGSSQICDDLRGQPRGCFHGGGHLSRQTWPHFHQLLKHWGPGYEIALQESANAQLWEYV